MRVQKLFDYFERIEIVMGIKLMNILVVTSIYPREDAAEGSTATKVVHYFVKEWEKLGHKVIVIHAPNRILYFTYYLPVSIREKLKAMTGNEFPDKSMLKKGEFPYDGVTVYRRPVFKLIPRSLSNNFLVNQCAKEIAGYLRGIRFTPDLIVGHWETPVIQLINELGKRYDCKKSIVFHGNAYANKYPERMKELLKNYDAIGTRSLVSSIDLQRMLDISKRPFVCYSGIPDSYVDLYKPDYTKFQYPIRNFIYVGTLIARKNCDSLIKALAKQEARDWHLDIVGDGAEKQNLMALSQELKVEGKITFHGKVPRETVIELMQKAQCFIMNSRGEVFGLVYLEAMLANCITVASLKEGMDGIINDGENGFLVEAGDVQELSNTIERIRTLTTDKATAIAEAGYRTGCNYTDSKVAARYLESIETWNMEDTTNE